MLKLEKNIREILKDDYERYMSTSVSIAKLIAEVAHKRQTRLDGTSYIKENFSVFIPTYPFLKAVTLP